MKLIIFDWGSTLYNPETESLFTDTKTTLDHLQSKGYTMVIVSLATAGPTKIKERWEIIKQEGLEQYFETILFDVANKAKMYEETLRELRVTPSDVIIVDDRVIRGVAWGNNHGCNTVWLQQGKFAQETPNEETGDPGHIIHTIGELQTIL